MKKKILQTSSVFLILFSAIMVNICSAELILTPEDKPDLTKTITGHGAYVIQEGETEEYAFQQAELRAKIEASAQLMGSGVFSQTEINDNKLAYDLTIYLVANMINVTSSERYIDEEGIYHAKVTGIPKESEKVVKSIHRHMLSEFRYQSVNLSDYLNENYKNNPDIPDLDRAWWTRDGVEQEILDRYAKRANIEYPGGEGDLSLAFKIHNYSNKICVVKSVTINHKASKNDPYYKQNNIENYPGIYGIILPRCTKTVSTLVQGIKNKRMLSKGGTLSAWTIMPPETLHDVELELYDFNSFVNLYNEKDVNIDDLIFDHQHKTGERMTKEEEKIAILKRYGLEKHTDWILGKTKF